MSLKPSHHTGAAPGNGHLDMHELSLVLKASHTRQHKWLTVCAGRQEFSKQTGTSRPRKALRRELEEIMHAYDTDGNGTLEVLTVLSCMHDCVHSHDVGGGSMRSLW